MLSDRNRNGTLVKALRIVPAKPRKGILIIRNIRPLRLTDIENLLQLIRNIIRTGTLIRRLVLSGETDYQRLAIRRIEQAVPLPGLVESVIDPLQGGPGPGVGVESNLRHLEALRSELLESPEHRSYRFRIDVGVGSVEHKVVDPGIGKKLDMAGNHPRVAAVIVAIKRLTPEMELPGRTLRSTLHAPEIRGRLLQQLCDVEYARLLARVLSQPDKIEYSDIPPATFLSENTRRKKQNRSKGQKKLLHDT